MEHLNNMMDLVLGRLENVTQSDIVVGDAIKLGEMTIVPLSRLAMGFGMAGGEGEGDVDAMHAHGMKKARGKTGMGKGKGMGGGTGMGAKVRPVAIVVFGPNGVDIHEVPNKKGTIEKIFDKVPELMELAKEATGKN